MTDYGGGFHVIEAIRSHINPILYNLCWGDTIEADAMGISTSEMFKDSFDYSIEAYTVTLNGKPISMFGITKPDFMNDKAMLWILSSKDIYKVGMKVARHSREYIDKWLKEYSELYNYIHCDNKKAIRWAKYVGAILSEPIELGKNKQKFVKFVFSQNFDMVRNMFRGVSNMSPRERIMTFEKFLEEQPNAIRPHTPEAPPLQHDFAGGMYVRTIHMPKGMMLTGMIHKHEHPSFLLKGKVEVFTEQDGYQVLEAPLVFTSQAGVKRVLRMLEDTIWSTVHLNPSDTRDIKKLEDELATNNYNDLEHTVEVMQCQCCG